MGDELNYKPLLDRVMSEEFKTLEPHHVIPGVSKPGEISGRLTLDSPNTNTLAAYLEDGKVYPGDDSLYNLI